MTLSSRYVRPILLPAFVLALLAGPAGATFAAEPPAAEIDRKVEALLQQMTLEEKAGQLNQLSGDFATGPTTPRGAALADEVRKGRVGSVLNTSGAAPTRALQKIAVEETRLHIPLLFAMDVIHGYRTIFPVPLAEAASWELESIERSARIAAVEASAAGLHWTFAPMVDIARDARWGRVMEGAGEDPYLGARIAAARVRGFQGDDLSRPDTILACVKHFAAYGAVEAGREYNTTTVSVRQLREVYLPPFEAAVRAGAATLMNAFNDVDGVPASGSELLVKRILRGEWGFGGVVVSDWASFGEMVAHGVAADKAEAALLALRATSDVDMEARAYIEELPRLVRSGRAQESEVDALVRRVLRLKHRLGLFEDPYRYSDEGREKASLVTAEHRAAARDMARKSMVLLRNEGGLLPLKAQPGRLALIGPFADSARDMLGNWAAKGDARDAVTLLGALRTRLGEAAVVHAPGCGAFGQCTDEQIAAGVQAAQAADVVLLAVGEPWNMSGEGASRASLELPGRQMDLVRAIHAAGKPTVVVLFGGRPLTINWIAENVPAVLEAWLPGLEAGNAIADVLFGDFNPAGKLPVSFPYAVGQVPIYYAQKNTGRPYTPGTRRWDVTRYRDIPNEPLFPFGFGLSYTTFRYDAPRVERPLVKAGEPIEVVVTVTNTGAVAGDEVVQLYLRDLVASVTRPVKELRRFERIRLEPGASREVRFVLQTGDLAFYDQELRLVTEPGDFVVMTGPNSRDTQEARFRLQ